MNISGSNRPTYLNFGGFNQDEYRFSTADNNIGRGRVIEGSGEHIATDLQTGHGQFDTIEVTPGDSQSGLTSTLIDAGTSAAAGVAESVIDDNPQPKPEPQRLDTSVLALFPSKDDKKTIRVIVPDPAPPAPEPIAEFDGLKKITAAPGTKPAIPGTGIDPAAPLLDPTTDANREARENRVYDLLFDGNPVTRFSTGLGYGPFTPQEAMALRFFAARHSEELQQLRDLHGPEALQIAARAIIDVLQENAGQMLPQQHIIDAHFNAALNLALNPDNLQQEFEAASRAALFGPVYNLFQDSIYTNPTLSRESRDALTRFMAENVDRLIYLAARVGYAERPELINTLLQIMRDQGDGPVAYEFFEANLKAAINLFLIEHAALPTQIIPALQQDAQERFEQAEQAAEEILRRANAPFADRDAVIREAFENGDVYLQMALMHLLPPELGDAVISSADMDPATSTALLNHLRNMRADEAAGVLEALEANPGNVAPEILDALRAAVDPRSAMSSETKLKYDNYIANGTFSEARYRNLQRLNPDRSPEEIINFLALLNQGITLPGYITREPEPPQPPGESNFGPVGRPTQEELDALQQRLEAESAAIYAELDSGDTVLSPSEIEEKLDRAGIQGMVADAIMLNPGSIRILRDSEGIAGVAVVGMRDTYFFDNRPAAFYVQDLLRVGETRGVTLPLLQALYREAEAVNLPLALRPLNDRVAAYYESLGGQRTEAGEMIWYDMPRPVGQ